MSLESVLRSSKYLQRLHFNIIWKKSIFKKVFWVNVFKLMTNYFQLQGIIFWINFAKKWTFFSVFVKIYPSKPRLYRYDEYFNEKTIFNRKFYGLYTILTDMTAHKVSPTLCKHSLI